jgi:hypothetical protein
MTLTYTCAECAAVFHIDYTPPVVAQTYGSPENCHPYEDESFDPEECPECDAPVDLKELETLIEDKIRNFAYDYEED